MNVAHVIVNNLGGITSLVQNLVLYKGSKALPQELFLLDIKDNPNEKSRLDKDVLKLSRSFVLNPLDNWYHTYGKLAKILSENKGVLVSNDQYDLIMLQAFNIPRKVVQMVHDPYNIDLSLKFHEVIDCFITHSQNIFETLVEKIPNRTNDIKFIHYGILLYQPMFRRLKKDTPLRLVFLGRHDKSKGIFDLHDIDNLLKQKNIHLEWLILGKGPETDSLHKQWIENDNVHFETPNSYKDLIMALRSADIMVFPTKFEGFPVALLECMSQGCLPVVTDLPGGIRELVVDGVNGFKCDINNNQAFVFAIERLQNNRDLLLDMQNKASSIIHGNYDASCQSPLYQEIFHSLTISDTLPKHHLVHRKIGSRLDHPLLPNIVTSFIRNIIK